MTIKALVVDNNPVLLRAVSAILDQEGCIVQTAGTGLEALEIVDTFCPDIVFTDLIMPMVGGEQLCRILRNTKKHQAVFIVVLSAIILEDRDRILREIECDLCIAKGNLEEIRQHIQGALRSYLEREKELPGKADTATRIPDGLRPSDMTSELLLEKRHLSEILANLQEGIVELNHQGKVVAANSSALTILSCPEEKLIGMRLFEAIDWGGFETAIHRWTEKQLVASGMAQLEIFEDAPLFVDDRVVTASFLPVAEHGSVFGLCILRDISRQFKAEKHHKELDNALRLVKKMDAMSCMAGGVAHDFNNLLTVICGNLDIVDLYGDKQGSDECKKMLDKARNAALVAVDLTRQISCFSNFGIVSREKVRIEQLVRNTVGEFFNWQKEKYSIDVVDTDVFVHADPEELSQGVVNVLQNAVEASREERFRLDIVMAACDFAVPQLLSGQYVPAGKYFKIDIADSGRGIHPEELFRIFDPYYSTKARGSLKGMGFGLTVVYAILRNHGGYVVVSSVPEQGTTVSLYLPVLLEEMVLLHPDGQTETRQERTVLLVEPDQQMREMGTIMLGYLGFSVRAVTDRAGAVGELRQIQASPASSRPLVILALAETNGESAVETCRLLHEIDPDLKVIAMSGTTLDPVMENCREHGFVNILPKPFSMDSLKHITNRALQS